MNINQTVTLIVEEGVVLYLFCFIVFYLTPVLIRFVKICVCRDLYTTRARMHIASP